MPPLVTILIPTHNRAAMLGDAVTSALAQTYSPLEIIILDNESKDDTPAVASAFASRDAQVRYVRHPVDLGITGNWRAGIGLARGDFLCLLHDDDTVEPAFVKTLAQPLLADPTLALSFCEHGNMDKDRRPIDDESHLERFARKGMPEGPLRGEALARAILFDYSVPVGCSLFRRSVVTPEFIDDRAKGSIDYWLLYRILQTGLGAYYVPERLMSYRVHGGGMSGSAVAYMAEGHLFRLGEMLADPQLAAHREELKAARCRTLTDYGIELTQLGRRKEARRAFAESLRKKPAVRTLVSLAFSCVGTAGSNALKRWRTRVR